MARPKKGEKLLGVTKPCRYCGIEIYRRPAAVETSKTFFHMGCLKKQSFSFPCVICKKKVLTQPAQIKYRNRKTCSKECRAVVIRNEAIKRRIEKGYTKHQIDRLARYSPEADSWRKKVFERDNWTCQMCFKRGNRLEADHIKPWAYYPELRFELTNGRTLCRPCHDTTKISSKKMREIYEKDTIKA